MKPFMLEPGLPPPVVADWMLEHEWSLADVLQWYAGKPCGEEIHAFHGQARSLSGPCSQCYSDPPAEYGRDVIVAYIEANGSTHAKHLAFAKTMRQWTLLGEYTGIIGPHPLWHDDPVVQIRLKRRILRLFSGPVEEGGVRIVTDDHGRLNGQPLQLTITPEQLLPPLMDFYEAYEELRENIIQSFGVPRWIFEGIESYLR